MQQVLNNVNFDAQPGQAIANLLKGRTSFIIAHRLATVTNADKVLVIITNDQ